MATATVHPARDAEQIGRLLDLPRLDARCRADPGPRRAARRDRCGAVGVGVLPVRREVAGAPRRARRLLDAVVGRLGSETDGMGDRLAIDGSDLPAYANGQRNLFNGGPERTHFADTDASWGHRSSVGTRKGAGFYGYKVHAAVDVTTELPVAWVVTTARESETGHVGPLVDEARRRGLSVETCALDKGYDTQPVHDALTARNVRPVIPLRMTGRVVRGEDKPPTCDPGTWTFAGADTKRQATKWRCPTGDCQPKSVWVKADRLHPLIPRETARYKALYRERTAVERGSADSRTSGPCCRSGSGSWSASDSTSI